MVAEVLEVELLLLHEVDIALQLLILEEIILLCYLKIVWHLHGLSAGVVVGLAVVAVVLPLVMVMVVLVVPGVLVVVVHHPPPTVVSGLLTLLVRWLHDVGSIVAIVVGRVLAAVVAVLAHVWVHGG